MKLIVTGASGAIGSELVPRLRARGMELLLVGRDAEGLKCQFPGLAACNYEELATMASGFDAMINLAVLNSNAEAPERDFLKINAELPVRLATIAASTGVPRFIYVSSLHALDEGRSHPYAASKRVGREKLRKIDGIEVIALYLPAVYGERWTGRWSFMNRLHGFSKHLAISALTAFKPAIDIDTLCGKLIDILAEDSSAPDIVVSKGQQDNPFYQTIRRIEDLAAAIAILVLFWWLLAAIWALVKLKSDGPGIFAQERVGRKGKTFTCYKFRTMHVGTKQAASHELTNASVTSFGKFLRRTKLDELPQAWNLLTGEMTLVGPRPCLPSQAELIRERSQAGVFELTPGITGLAQVNGIDMSIPRELVVYDQRYLGMQSLVLDLKLLILTVVGKGSGDRVSN